MNHRMRHCQRVVVLVSSDQLQQMQIIHQHMMEPVNTIRVHLRDASSQFARDSDSLPAHATHR